MNIKRARKELAAEIRLVRSEMVSTDCAPFRFSNLLYTLNGLRFAARLLRREKPIGFLVANPESELENIPDSPEIPSDAAHSALVVHLISLLIKAMPDEALREIVDSVDEIRTHYREIAEAKQSTASLKEPHVVEARRDGLTPGGFDMRDLGGLPKERPADPVSEHCAHLTTTIPDRGRTSYEEGWADALDAFASTFPRRHLRPDVEPLREWFRRNHNPYPSDVDKGWAIFDSLFPEPKEGA